MSRGSSRSVAIIGAGPAGLAAAKYLYSHGFRPTILERHSGLGGQWDCTSPSSGIWLEMRTNTASCVTRLSDVRYPETVALFPHNRDVLAMLRAFAAQNGLEPLCHFGAEVTGLARAEGGGWRLDWIAGESAESAVFPRVVVAPGRFNAPFIPEIAGLSAFAGAGGAIHAFHYPGPEPYAGQRVVVAGGNISALEIASDVAMRGAARVHLAQRRQRYVVPKVAAGTPIEYLGLTRESALALETTAPDALHAARKRFLLNYGGDPVGYGAPAPDPDVERAGVTGAPYYLDLVAEDRIAVHPWISRIDGTRVTFTDGSAVEADAIILGTGFALHLPFLAAEIAAVLRCDRNGLHLAHLTFHPDLPGLAFLGLYQHFGPYMVGLEQQARYVAYSWAGVIAPPNKAALRAALRHSAETGLPLAQHQSHHLAIRFARLAGTDPADVADSGLATLVAKSAITPEMFRIGGPDRLDHAVAHLSADFAAHAPAASKRAVAAAHAERPKVFAGDGPMPMPGSTGCGESGAPPPDR